MKKVLLSVRPPWSEQILSGKKTFELRKNKPNTDTPFKCYLYETQGKTDTPWIDEDGHIIHKGCGRVVGDFICVLVERMRYPEDGLVDVVDKKKSCVSALKIIEYSNGSPLFAWHISEPKTYKHPKELSEFGVRRPPQSWCYVVGMEDKKKTCKDCFYNDGVHCLIDDGKEFSPEERACFKDKSHIVELPCNVGDTVYFITGIHRNLVKSARVEEITINDSGVSDLFVLTDNCSFENDIEVFFFTREEAEKALKEREHDDL